MDSESGLSTLFLMTFPQSHTRCTAILLDELDAGRFESMSDRQVVGGRQRGLALSISSARRIEARRHQIIEDKSIPDNLEDMRANLSELGLE
jgi:hypothetical protein